MKRLILLLVPCLALCQSRFTGSLHGYLNTAPTVIGNQATIQLSGDGTYLVNAAGTPVFITGDAAWSLIARLNITDANIYLANRAAKGFNVVIVNLMEHAFAQNCNCGWGCPNLAGTLPFPTDQIFTAPNESYFVYADSIIDAAAGHGITVLLDPIYLGYDCGCQGWCASLKGVSNTVARNWGQWVGNRYKGRNNIVWLIGGDCDPVAQGADTKTAQVALGIKDVDSAHLMTAHNNVEESSQDIWNGASWLNLNGIYSYTVAGVPGVSQANYQRSGALPQFGLEFYYTDPQQTITDAQARGQWYWAVLAGSNRGTFYGDDPIWHFNSVGEAQTPTWQDAMEFTISYQIGYAGALMRSRRHWLMVPDFAHSVLTAGYSSGANVAVCSRASDGSSIIVFMPNSRQVTIDMSKIADTGSEAKCWWYNPRDASTTLIGTYANSGTRNFTPPDNNDWVLVIDSNALGFVAPGA